jgi:hypothetical protein
LEQESAFFFNLKYFEEKNLVGMSVRTYLNGFIKINKNQYSVKMLFEMRKEKYFEVLDR